MINLQIFFIWKQPLQDFSSYIIGYESHEHTSPMGYHTADTLILFYDNTQSMQGVLNLSKGNFL